MIPHPLASLFSEASFEAEEGKQRKVRRRLEIQHLAVCSFHDPLACEAQEEQDPVRTLRTLDFRNESRKADGKAGDKRNTRENPWEWIKATVSSLSFLRHTRKWKWGGHSHCSKATEVPSAPPSTAARRGHGGRTRQPALRPLRPRPAPPSLRPCVFSASEGGRASAPLFPAGRARLRGVTCSGSGAEWRRELEPPPGPVPAARCGLRDVDAGGGLSP